MAVWLGEIVNSTINLYGVCIVTPNQYVVLAPTIPYTAWASHPSCSGCCC